MNVAPKRYSKPLIAAGAGAVLLAAGATWLWIERTPIASSYIDDALRARGVPASYRLARIGFRTQRIEAIRIGDPDSPDLTADWAEIGLSVGLGGVRVRAIDAAGVRLRGRLVDGKLSLGAIDRLLPATDGRQAFALPDIALTARTMRFDLVTPQGLLRAKLDGDGNLRDGFRGRLGFDADRLTAGGCAILRPHARLALTIRDSQPVLMGPVGGIAVTCEGGSLRRPLVDLAARGDRDLARWRGAARILRGAAAGAGLSTTRLGGRLDFDASAQRLDGKADLFADQLLFGRSMARRAAVSGDYRYDLANGRASFAGTARLSGARPDPAMIDGLVGRFATAAATPAGPILAAWGRGIRQAALGIDGSATVSIRHGPAGGGLHIGRLAAAAAGGGHLSIRGEQAEGLGWRWPQQRSIANASAELGGGGLPDVRLSLRQPTPESPLTGSATIGPYATGGARLRLGPVRFGPAPGGATLVTTRVTMDGPLADGRVDGLDLPVTARIGQGGAWSINPRCAPLGFDRLAIGGTVIGRTRLPLCPVGGALFGRRASGSVHGGASIAGPRLRGRVGDQPLLMTAASLGVRVGRPGFALDRLAVRLGDSSEPTRLDVAALDGSIDDRGISGQFTGADGKIGAVPLLMSRGSGRWSLASGVLTLDGAIDVADAERLAARFKPLTANDVALTLKAGRIAASGTLREPRSGLAVAAVHIRHDLSRGAGEALLDVDGLRFGRPLQPEAITPLTLGMIANVDGILSGQGRIRWKDGQVGSDGRFRTTGINFAAAFGPVTGLKGEIQFTDLLGLVTAPDQSVTIVEVNPGIAVTNGVIRYRILAGHKLAVADGTWPFSGGTLTLEPTVLDMAQPVARRLTFRIAGLDGATFVQQLDFKNLAVTGKFDGVLPIIFDSQGGRIENGLLTVREEGGTLSYVGDVTNADLGRMSRVAFDALKSMRYRRLTIDLNGSLDGEIISRVRFDGTNSAPRETARAGGLTGRFFAPLTRLPFRFNITIAAPFRGLVNSAQTFVDPSIAIRNADAYKAPPTTGNPPDSAPIQPR